MLNYPHKHRPGKPMLGTIMVHLRKWYWFLEMLSDDKNLHPLTKVQILHRLFGGQYLEQALIMTCIKPSHCNLETYDQIQNLRFLEQPHPIFREMIDEERDEVLFLVKDQNDQAAVLKHGKIIMYPFNSITPTNQDK